MKPTALMFFLLLAGCAVKPDQSKVRLANVGPGLQTHYLPITLAGPLGFFKDEGLTVTIENLTSSPKAMQALIGGSVDVASIGYLQTVELALEGQRVRSIFVAVQRVSNALVVTAKGSENIRRIQDLKGAVIGIPSPGSPTQLWMNYLLSTHGVQPSEVSAVAIGVSASAIAAAESGRIDAAGLSGGDHIRLLRRNPGLRVLVDGATPEGMRESMGSDPYVGGTLAAKQAWLDQNPDAASRLARALQRALQWVNSHTAEEIRDRLPATYRSQDAASDLAVIRWSKPIFTPDGRMPKGGPEAMERMLATTVEKVRTAKIELASTWTNEYLPAEK